MLNLFVRSSSFWSVRSEVQVFFMVVRFHEIGPIRKCSLYLRYWKAKPILWKPHFHRVSNRFLNISWITWSISCHMVFQWRASGFCRYTAAISFFQNHEKWRMVLCQWDLPDSGRYWIRWTGCFLFFHQKWWSFSVKAFFHFFPFFVHKCEKKNGYGLMKYA